MPVDSNKEKNANGADEKSGSFVQTLQIIFSRIPTRDLFPVAITIVIIFFNFYVIKNCSDVRISFMESFVFSLIPLVLVFSGVILLFTIGQFFRYKKTIAIPELVANIESKFNDHRLLIESRMSALEAKLETIVKYIAPIGKDFETVQELVTRTIINKPSGIETAKAHLISRRPEKAIPILEQLNKKKPNQPDVLRNLSYAFYDLGETDNAIRFMNEAIKTLEAFDNTEELEISQSYFHLARYLESKYHETNKKQYIDLATEAFDKIKHDKWLKKAYFTPDLSVTRKNSER